MSDIEEIERSESEDEGELKKEEESDEGSS